MRRLLLLSALILALPARAAELPPLAEPQSQDWLKDNTFVELRLKGEQTTKGTWPTVRLEKDIVFGNLSARYLSFKVSCWNTSKACPPVVALTYRVYVRIPWLADKRFNLTNRAQCSTSECTIGLRLPDGTVSKTFPPLVAKPGEQFSFRFDRVTGVFEPAPSVLSPPASEPTLTQPSSADQSIPPLVSITAPDGAVWTFAGTVALRNGQTTGWGELLLLKNATMYLRQSDGQWWTWNGSGWQRISTAP